MSGRVDSAHAGKSGVPPGRGPKKASGKLASGPAARRTGKRATSRPGRKDSGTGAPPKYDFPIIGIGASAGGLKSFEEFFSGIPSDTKPGMAFVLVQHLAPDHKSILTDLVKRYTRMEVFEVEDGMVVRPDCTYIIPPNRDMALLNGALHLLEPSAPRGQRMPIDFLFHSMALELRERAICIVLSGTGSDGTIGIRAVKAEGGTVLVQEPETAEFDGMPRSAISTGLVDYSIPAAEMSPMLIAFASRSFGKSGRPSSPALEWNVDALKKIFILLRSQTGHDFSLYKPGNISRRIDRRMALHQIEGLDRYLRFLQKNASEVDALFRDLLIGVTSFFRDPEAFSEFEKEVVPRLFRDKQPGESIRVWVPGCSSGEEAYSIAILLQERMLEMKRDYSIQVFATDIDRRAIEQARAGVYPASAAADVSPGRLSRFFTQDQDGRTIRINKIIRDMLVFSEQDVIKDPPFSRVDLVSCRNLLIYMGADLQRRVLALFHYALKPGGYLFLGTSETVGKSTNLFAPMERRSRIYVRKEDPRGAGRVNFGSLLGPVARDVSPLPATKAPRTGTPRLKELVEGALLRQFAPAAALVNGRGDVVYLQGRIGRYLEIPAGEFDPNILRMAREGLGEGLTAALHKAVNRKEQVKYPGLKVRTDGGVGRVDLTVRPVDPDSASPPQDGLFLAIFEDVRTQDRRQPGKAASRDTGGRPGDRAEDGPAAGLRERELQAKEEYIQTILEELEMSREEFKSSTEEMQSVNEELQSTNEELETSKEELQSVNEELATVNAELQAKVQDLSRSNNDMSNLLAGTGIGTVFVDMQLRIMRFTPAALQLINLIPSDVGRPVNHIVTNIAGYDRLADDLRSVLENLVPREIEVQTVAGETYSMRIQPYRTMDNVIEGAVITFVNISLMKRAQESLRRLAVVVRDSNDAITVRDMKGAIMAWNPAAERLYGWSEAEALAMNMSDIMPKKELEKELLVVKRIGLREAVTPYRSVRRAKDGREFEVWMTASALVDNEGKMYAIATTERLVG